VTAHALVLVVHGALRWVIVALLLLVVARAARGWRKAAPWSASDERAHRGLIAAIDLQFLLGLILYLVLSPLPRAALAYVGLAMKDPVLRFFGIEHVFGMVIGIGLVHVGRTRSKKVTDERRRHRVVLSFTVAGALAILVTLPWPGRKYERPLLRTSLGGSIESGGPEPACPPAYASRCASCHGERGRGDGSLAAYLATTPRDLGGRSWSRARTDADVARVIREGGPAVGLSPVMPPHTDLEGAELDEMVRCVRSFAR
jgi:hypothetical protein